MTTNSDLEVKKKCLKKLFSDIPQRVIVHKILINHEVGICEDDAEDPYKLFGYFKYDRLRNIWFIFSSVCVYSNEGNAVIKKMSIMDYSKLYSANLQSSIPNISEFSSKMFSLRSIRCYSCSIPENFFSKFNFPNLSRFILEEDEGNPADFRDWHECVFFDRLKVLTLFMTRFGTRSRFSSFTRFFQSKKNVFGKNLMILNLSNVTVNEEKVIMFLPNLKVLSLIKCSNLIIIPSEKKLKTVVVFYSVPIETETHNASNAEIEHIAKNSRFCSTISVQYSKEMVHMFDNENFPNLEDLGFQDVSSERRNEPFSKKWKFCSLLKEFNLTTLLKEVDFFQNNEWDELERLSLRTFDTKFKTKNVKFPKLRLLKINTRSDKVFDDFFQFQGKSLEKIKLKTENAKLTGRDWNENIFRSLRVLNFGNEFDDSFFQRHEFPNLRKLILVDNRSLINRESWKEMKSLEKIKTKGICFLSEWRRD